LIGTLSWELPIRRYSTPHTTARRELAIAPPTASGHTLFAGAGVVVRVGDWLIIWRYVYWKKYWWCF
jgi:hypothetical protein